jgi:DNA-binding response OmpR family regulator
MDRSMRNPRPVNGTLAATRARPQRMDNWHLFELLNAGPGLDSLHIAMGLLLGRGIPAIVALAIATGWMLAQRHTRLELLQMACAATMAWLLAWVTVKDRIGGLEAGADDHVLKPFDLDELVARVRALLRRRAGAAAPVLRCGTLALDPPRKTVTPAGHGIDLSAKKLALLETLMQRAGAVLSREKLEKLEKSVYGGGEDASSNAIEVHLHDLRRELGATVIRNVRGVGCRLAED